jgi:SAM-dependent methyltransferase
MASDVVNVEQAESWDGHEGEFWATHWDRFDESLRDHNTRLLEAARITTHEHVLDIGCGNGRATRDAARAASAGTALGVDLSSAMLARARAQAVAEGVGNVTFEQADAQVHAFEADSIDVAISRFGAMFFSDPVAAFSNIGRALRSGGRLSLVSWQPLAQNEWLTAMRSSLAMGRELPEPLVGAPGQFGLADPDQVRRILDDAGYVDVDVTEVREQFHVGPNVDEAFSFVREIPVVKGLVADLDDATTAEAFEQLRQRLVAHETADGVQLGSCAWLVTARRE